MTAAQSLQPSPLAVLGVNVVPFESYDHAVQCVAESIRQGRKSFWVAVNPQKVHRARHDPAVMDVLRQADAGICDGIGVTLASLLLHRVGITRVTGCDLFFHLLAAAEQKDWSVFLLGASPQANAQAAQRLAQRYPRLRIVGRQDGYFTDDGEVIARINAARPDLLFVAMGSPRQEFWIASHRERIDARFFMGVGGTLDVASGLARRAPAVFRKTGTEFLYQLLNQPWRWRRQIVYFPYMASVLRESLLGRSSHTGTAT